MASPNRPTDLPKSTNDTTYFFLLAAKSPWLHLAFSWQQLVKIPLIFVPSQQIENRWTSDRKREFSRWAWFKRKEWKNVRFWAWKTSEKRLFYRLKRNSFMFRLFGMLHRQIEADKKQLILISNDSLRLYQNLCRLIFAYITAYIRIEVIHYFVYPCLSPG